MITDNQTSSPDSSSVDLSKDTSNTPAAQWIAVHNLNIIGMYGSQNDAMDALNGYKMNVAIDINDAAGVYQII